MNITELRERIRNEQHNLDALRARNRKLADDEAASYTEIEAAMAETRAASARIRMMQDDLDAEERRQSASLQAAPAKESLLTDNKREILRSNEYARAFAYAMQHGLNRKNGRGDERCKILFDALTESGGTPAGSDGGFLVPEDIDHQIRELRRTLNPLAELFAEETVSAPTGWRVVDTAPTKGLVAVDEMGTINSTDDQPVFSKITYSTSKFALILPISNELLTDNVANLFGYVSGWFARKLVLQENALLVAAMKTLTAVNIGDDLIGGLKKALNVALDPEISALATIIMNQNAFDALDQVKDEMGRPMLQPDPTNATEYRIKGRPVKVVSNATIAESDIYVGDGKEFATLFRCGGYEFASTDVGGSAWRTDSTEVRGIARLGVTKFDEAAMVRRSFGE